MEFPSKSRKKSFSRKHKQLNEINKNESNNDSSDQSCDNDDEIDKFLGSVESKSILKNMFQGYESNIECTSSSVDKDLVVVNSINCDQIDKNDLIGMLILTLMETSLTLRLTRCRYHCNVP